VNIANYESNEVANIVSYKNVVHNKLIALLIICNEP
jgi:hypothetical protein